ncbi:MAG: hypothetical protein WBZ42_01230 [Halobacteriota archaeon]
MREPYDSSAQYGIREQDESVLGLSDLASLPAFIYLLFFLFVLVVYSANPLEPQVFGFYKLSVFFQVVSFFSIFFVPTLLIYFALDLTKSVAHTCIVLLYPLLALGGVTILNVADLPLLAALSGFVLFAFYFLLGLSHSATERRRRTPRARHVVRPSPVTQAPLRMPPQRRPQDERAAIQKQRASQYAPPSRPQEFRRDSRPQYGASDGFLSRLDRFLDRYDYVEGEAVRKGLRRDVTHPRDRRRGRR